MIQRLFNWRLLFFVIAIAIISGTIGYSRYLANKIEKEERQRVAEWLQANKAMQATQDPASINLANQILVNNEDMPLIATDEKDSIIDYRNIDTHAIKADAGYLAKKLSKLKTSNKPIPWEISDNPRVVYNVYYGNTRLLDEVSYYPFIQLCIVALFVVLVLSLVSTQNRSTQNQVWAGMAKETAHQMGTPLTSLQGWVEILKTNNGNEAIVAEMEKDISRLKLVSDRFGKIGSTPQLIPTDLVTQVAAMEEYIRRRASGKVSIQFQKPENPVVALISPPLFDWVLENLLKNALDAMEGKGLLTISMTDQPQSVFIDVTDTGKGIPAGNFKTVFKPGYTTKKRGWGLGLSLSKRIMEQYHKGELFVKQSEPGKGTTFRMVIHR